MNTLQTTFAREPSPRERSSPAARRRRSRISHASVIGGLVATALLAASADARQELERRSTRAPMSQTVSYADLDLTQVADVDALLDRVARAAVEVCGLSSEGRRNKDARIRCIRGAYAAAVRELLARARSKGSRYRALH